ncbi:presenilin family intramembrane aspartyl protease PSH [Methanohalophilus profundi]|uniref:presenilin family intramembrane aspartyl protease PSH n=1 Tax=Methanohalophilus profundi TaxID=2138083 RepID=UPI00101CDDC3|nr:presenilin family intramembrane aspartyl protease PSH [Methanohalophilus profundi]
MSDNENGIKEYFPMIVMAGFILVIQIIALTLAQPMNDLGMQAVDNPQSATNSIYYIIAILIFTLFLLFAIKKEIQWVIQMIILVAVASTMYYGFYPLFHLTGLGGEGPIIGGLLMATVFTILLYVHPEWYIIDFVGIIVGAAASSIFGISFGILPAIVLLGLLAAYDAISVYKTKHMIALAEGVMDLKLPILFVIPKKRNYSFIEDTPSTEGEKEAFYMGLGDAIMPTIIVVSANVFLPHEGFVGIPAIGAMVGTLIGFFALTILVMKGKPQAGLPFLNSGAILGYVAGALIAGMPLLG